jgi:hypothetical protein
LKPYEPVAFFHIDAGTTSVVELDVKRTCRFVMLKPTGLRTKPRPYKEKFLNESSIEIEFFGVQGTTEPYEAPADCFQFDDRSTVNAQDP